MNETRADCSLRADAQARTPSVWCFNLSASECGGFFSSAPDKLVKPHACVVKGSQCVLGELCERFSGRVTAAAPAILESLPMGLRGREHEGATALAGRWRIRLTGDGRSASLWHYEDSIFGSQRFYSLFTLWRTGHGAYVVSAPNGGWLHLRQPKSALRPPVLEALDPEAGGSGGTAVAKCQPATKATPPGVAQRFWLNSAGNGAYRVQLSGGLGFLQPGSDFRRFFGRKIGAATAATFEFIRVVEPLTASSRASGDDLSDFNGDQAVAVSDAPLEARVRRSTTRVAGREVVLATHYGIDDIDWAGHWWGWFRTTTSRFLLLDFDGLACAASKKTLGEVVSCIGRGDDLSSATPGGSSLWKAGDATDAPKILRWQEKIVEKAGVAQAAAGYVLPCSPYLTFAKWKVQALAAILRIGVDVVYAGVDVLALSPELLPTLVRRSEQQQVDLLIASDARDEPQSQRGSLEDPSDDDRLRAKSKANIKARSVQERVLLACPAASAMVQRYTLDWVRTDLMLLRSTKPALWFMREMQALMAQDRHISDHEAAQVLLTGHTQLAVPQLSCGSRARAAALQEKQSSCPWLKSIWVERPGLYFAQGMGRTMSADQRIKHGINTPLTSAAWKRVEAERRASGFTWRSLGLREHGNGASLVRNWDSIFRRRNAMKNVIRARAGGYLSIQASCGAKKLLFAGEASGGNWSFRTFLLRHGDPAIFTHKPDPSPEYLTDTELRCYMERYPDLTTGFRNSSSGKTMEKLMRYHWRTAGRAEKRNPLCANVSGVTAMGAAGTAEDDADEQEAEVKHPGAAENEEAGAATTDRDDKHAGAEEQETETKDPDAGKPIATNRIVSKGKKAKGGKHKRGRRRAKRGGGT